MPNIDLQGDEYDDERLMAVMLFPDDEDMRQFYHLRNDCARLTDTDADTVNINTQWLRGLLNAPSFDEIKKESVRSWKHGSIAGDLFLYIYIMDCTNVPEPSTGKAVYLLENVPPESGGSSNLLYGDGSKVPRSAPKIREFWAKFKPVAHIYAAYRFVEPHLSGDRADLADSVTDEEMQRILALSEVLREFGENFVPSRVGDPEPLLPQSRTWRVPEGYITEWPTIAINDTPPQFREAISKAYAKRHLP